MFQFEFKFGEKRQFYLYEESLHLVDGSDLVIRLKTLFKLCAKKQRENHESPYSIYGIELKTFCSERKIV